MINKARRFSNILLYKRIFTLFKSLSIKIIDTTKKIKEIIEKTGNNSITINDNRPYGTNKPIKPVIYPVGDPNKI